MESYTYDAWGNTTIKNAGGAVIATSAYGNRYLFQGREYSTSTGLYNFRARWYAPTIGRWLSKDPIGLEGGLNLYVFVENNPINLKDPGGLWGIQFGDVNIGVGDPWMLFDNDSWGDLGRGVAATTDGIIPFYDPFEEIYADECGTISSEYEWSKWGGEASRDVLLAAAGAGVASKAGKVSKAKQALKGVCFIAGTMVACENGLVPIDEIAVGDRVLTTDGDESESIQVDPKTWKKITLRMPNPEFQNDILDVIVLRSPEWILEADSNLGGWIYFELEEMGLSGPAQVINIEVCPNVKAGRGRVVLAAVTHFNDDVYELRLSDGYTLEPTGRHRLFSLDRNEWTQTENLMVGERLKTAHGEVTIVAAEHKGGVNRVFNIEVETKHCYYAGVSQILSHNVNPCAEGGKWIQRKPGSLGKFKGTDALRRENKMLRDAAKSQGLDVSGQRVLHEMVSGQGFSYRQIVEAARTLTK